MGVMNQAFGGFSRVKREPRALHNRSLTEHETRILKGKKEMYQVTFVAVFRSVAMKQLGSAQTLVGIELMYSKSIFRRPFLWGSRIWALCY